MKMKKVQNILRQIEGVSSCFLPSVVQSHFSSRFLCPVQIFLKDFFGKRGTRGLAVTICITRDKKEALQALVKVCVKASPQFFHSF